MTVLGNIVAVTSIIAVVTLIQGMNVYVTNADRFRRRRRQLHDPADSGRSEPRKTKSASATTRGSPWSRRGSQEVQRQHHGCCWPGECSAKLSYRTESLDSVRVQGVSHDYIDFSTFNVETGPSDQSNGGGFRPAGNGSWLGCRRSTVRPGGSARQDHLHRRTAFPRDRRQREEGIGRSGSRRTSSPSSRSVSFRRCSGHE